MSGVKRYVIRHGCVEEAFSLLPGELAFVLATDHDRIVSSLTEAGVKMQAERDQWQQEAVRIASAVCALGKMEFDQLTDDTKLIEVMAAIRKAVGERNMLDGRLYAAEGIIDDLNALVAGLEAERDTLRAEVEGLRKDAERYRWLRDRQLDDKTYLEPYIRAADDDPMCWGLNGNWADDRIDAALEASR